MTTRELRQMLFHVMNQEMTVRELRQKLFEVVDQDTILKDTELMALTKKYIKEETS
jgi:hypothetical protein